MLVVNPGGSIQVWTPTGPFFQVVFIYSRPELQCFKTGILMKIKAIQNFCYHVRKKHLLPILVQVDFHDHLVALS